MPHNFCELIEQSVRHLQGKPVSILPDFPTGGIADFSDYQDGLRGGKIKIRANVQIVDKKTLEITEIPFGTTTTSLIDSIISANDRDKIKIKKVEDNTARDVSIIIHLPTGESPHSTLDALYAFTDCEMTVSPNACIVKGDRPEFIGVSQILRESVDQTKDILEKELSLRLLKLQEKLHFANLEKIFISKRIYRVIEQCETWEQIIAEIRKGLKPYTKMFLREATDQDIERLTEIKIKRLSRFDSEQAEKQIEQLEKDSKEVEFNLKNLNDYAIGYYQKLLTDFGTNRKRRTQIKSFSTVDRKLVARANLKLFMDRKDGFIGTSLKGEHVEYLTDCSDMDEIIAFTHEGQFKVFKPDAKVYVGKGILTAKLFSRNDENCIYHLIYQDGKAGGTYAKRFTITSITRDKDYDLTRGTKESQVLYLSINPSGESENVRLDLKPKKGTRQSSIDLDFTAMALQNRTVVGTLVCKEVVQKVVCVERGESTLAATQYFYDAKIRRIVKETTEQVLGLTAVYLDAKRQDQFVKRFEIDSTQLKKRIPFLGDHPENKLLFVSRKAKPKVTLHFTKAKGAPTDPDTVDLAALAPVRNMSALGNKLSSFKVRKVDPAT
jgi:topoisomerase-4 subunit A